MATRTVTTNADSGTGSLRQAIADAANGDTIAFNTSVFPTNKSTQISLSSNLTIDKELTFNALSGDVRRVTINSSSIYRVVISISFSCTITFKGFVFTSSALKYNNGGAISIAGSSLCTLVMQDCDFINISLQNNYHGGALYAEKNCKATFTRCRFESLSVSGQGGGSVVYAGSGNTNGPFTFNNCSFINNTKEAIYIYNTSNVVTISNCVFSGSGDADILIGRVLSGSANLKFTGVNILSSGIVTSEQVGTLTINISGYCGVANIQENYIAATFSGSGFLALPSSATITLPNTIIRTVYGAGVSNFTGEGSTLSWSSTDSTKSVLLEKQNGANWDVVSTSATSPDTVSDEGVYRIWDGVTFLTASAVIPQTLIVTNTNATGAGSLAQAVLDARAVDTITFDVSLAGETITLNAGLGPRNEVTIVGLTDDDGNPAVIVDGNGNYTFNSSYPVHISNVAFDGGWGAFSSNGGFDGSTFENCTFENMDLNVFELSNNSQTAESVSFTDCVFSSNDAADMLVIGNVNVTLNGGDVLMEGIDLTNATTTVITNANYNGVGAYTAPSAGTVNITGSGNIALPDAAVVTTAATVTRSEFGAGVSAISASGSEIIWTSTDSTKSVLLEKQNGANWDVVSTSATSPQTGTVGDTYRIWDGVTFLTAAIPLPPQTLVVTNTNATGAGSLAQAVLDARAVDTITFDPSLSGSTITLNAGLGPRNEVTIVGLTDSDGNPAIIVDGNDNYTFNSSYPVHVSNVAFNGGWGAFSSNGGFDSSTFENCTFENMDLNVFELSNSSQTAESVSFTDCIFSSNDAADVLIIGNVNATLSGGNVLTEGIDLTNATTTVITNANYNGVGGYVAPTAGTASVAGSGNIALPDSAVVTVAQTVTRSEFGAGLDTISANNLTISWTATDSTKTVLLEVENGADWDTVDDDATSPTTVSTDGKYRVWDGVVFLTIDVIKQMYWLVKSWGVTSNGGGSDGATTHNWTVVNLPVNPNLGEEIE